MSTTVYASRADLAALGLPPAVLAVLSPARQDQALAAASATADSYLSNRYTLPLTAWDQSLRQKVCAIAAYESLAGSAIEMPEDIRKRYDDALKWFEGVAAEEIHPVVTDSRPAGASDGPVFVSRRPRDRRRC